MSPISAFTRTSDDANGIHPAQTKMKSKKALALTLGTCAVVQLVVFVALGSRGAQSLTRFMSTPDTLEYQLVASELSQGHLVATKRTLGYPLFLGVAYFLGGPENGVYWLAAAQLVLNILLTAMSWTLLERLAPETPKWIRVALTGVCFWAGFGLALNLLTDFLASFLFGVFLYGLLYWRSWRGTILSGTALAWATMVRPTFVFVPLLLLPAVYLINRCSARLRWSQLLTLSLVAAAGTGVNVWYQVSYNNYFGPSPIVAQNVERVLYMAIAEGQIDRIEHLKSFESEVSRRAGQSYDSLSKTDQQKIANEIFAEQLKLHPREILLLATKTFVKYLFCPVESLLPRIVAWMADASAYQRYVRPLLALIFLPIWILCLVPPVQGLPHRRSYYALVVLFWFYLAGITALNPRQGERIRFPVMAFLLPIAAWNIQMGYGYVRSRFGKLPTLSQTPEMTEGIKT